MKSASPPLPTAVLVGDCTCSLWFCCLRVYRVWVVTRQAPQVGCGGRIQRDDWWFGRWIQWMNHGIFHNDLMRFTRCRQLCLDFLCFARDLIQTYIWLNQIETWIESRIIGVSENLTRDQVFISSNQQGCGVQNMPPSDTQWYARQIMGHMEDGPPKSHCIWQLTVKPESCLSVTSAGWMRSLAGQMAVAQCSIFPSKTDWLLLTWALPWVHWFPFDGLISPNYFASSDPHHGIQFIPSDILSGKSSGILFGILFEILLAFYLAYFWHLSVISSDHSIWHIFWHSIWQVFLTFYLAYLCVIPSGMSSDILSGISSDILSGISSDILSGILSGRSSDILSGILFGILYGFVLAVEVRLRSGEAHGAQNLAGEVPASRISPVEVRRGPQRSDSHRLRSGEAHRAQTLAGWGPARPTALRLSPVEVRRGPQRSDSRRLRSGEAHCDQELADDVRRGPLLSRAGRWDLARLTAIKSWQHEERTNIKSTSLTCQVGKKRVWDPQTSWTLWISHLPHQRGQNMSNSFLVGYLGGQLKIPKQ